MKKTIIVLLMCLTAFLFTSSLYADTLTKHGAGSSSQTVLMGSPITSFYYSWVTATTVTVSGLPSGITATISTSAKTVTISGTPTVSGTFSYTITTVGGSPDATGGGTFTVTSSGYYVATNGSDTNNGKSLSTPFATVSKAVSVAIAGDVIFVRSGTYTCTARINLKQSGTSSSKITLRAYPESGFSASSRPVLNFSSMPIDGSNQGVLINGSYWYVYGLIIKGAGDNGMQISGGAYNTIEFCDLTENRDGGLQLKTGAHDNQIKNCDSYFNADYVSGSTTYLGGNADGFSPKLDCGTGNYFYGCRAWLNSDDGWDGILNSDMNITSTLENCWTWSNGYLKDGTTTTSSMNGNGFKMGGGWTTDANGVKSYTFRHNQVLKNCLAFNNKGKGFDQNHNKGSMTLYNCTAKGNGGKNFDIAEALLSGCSLTVKNSVAYDGASTVSLLSSGAFATNSWMSPFSVSSADFTSTSTSGVNGARNADGSLPTISFMHLASGSDLVNAGTDVGLTYIGSKPDLGCFESSYKSEKLDPEKIASVSEVRVSNYPNPFTDYTTIAIVIPETSDVTITITNLQGIMVYNVVKRRLQPGLNEIPFANQNLTKGMYICQVFVNGTSYSFKMNVQ